MNEIQFLTMEQIIQLHRPVIERFSPEEPLTLLSRPYLESAVAAPQVTWGSDYLYTSLAEMAAAYLFSLNQNHVFLAGNKRVAFAACLTFLHMNGLTLSLTEDEATDLNFRVARHEIEREEVASILAASIESISTSSIGE